MPLQQLVGVFLLAKEFSSYFLKDILSGIDQPKEQIKVRFVCRFYILCFNTNHPLYY